MSYAENKSLKYYIKILKFRKKTEIFVFLATVFFTALFSLLWTPSYQATATILVDYSNPNLMNSTNVPLPLSGSSLMEYLLTEKSIVESRTVAVKVIKALKLDQNPSIREAYESSLPSVLSPKIFFRKKTRDFTTWLVDYLNDSVDVICQPDSRIIKISIKSPNPSFSAALANAYAWSYNAYHLELKVSPLKSSVNWISRKVESLREDVERKTTKLEEYKNKKGVVETQDRYSIASQKLSRLNMEMVDAEAKFYEASIRKELATRLAKKGNLFDSLPEIISNTFIQNLKGEKVKLEKQLSELSNRVGTSHPQYINLKAELSTVRTKIKEEKDNIVKAIKSDYETSRKRKESLEQALERQKKNIMAIKRETSELNMLNLETDTAKKMYDSILTKFSETSLKGDINRTNVIIIDKAAPPSEPVSPKILLNIMLSVIVGPILAVTLVFFSESFNSTISDKEEIEADFGLPILGVIPRK
ncbi:MAG: GNVR domain-containing protein [bacterium]